MSTLVISLIVLLILLIIGAPITFAFFGATAAVVLYKGYDVLFLVPFAYNSVNSLILLAIPMFVFAGRIMEIGGIGRALVDFVSFFVGKIKGGLGIVQTLSCAAFGCVSGSGFATVSCVGTILLPRMAEFHYPKGHSAALLASSGVLGLLIPPSVNMILLAFIAQAPMLSCFFSTLLPAIILMTLLSIANCFLLRKNTEILDTYERPDTAREKFNLLRKVTFKALPAIVAPIIILGGIYGGFFTPTEAAAIAVLYSIPVGFFIYKGLNLRELLRGMIEAAATAGAIFIMLFTIMMLSRIYIMDNVPQIFMGLLNNVSDSSFVNLLIVNIFMLSVAMLMDDGSAILLLTPLMMPILRGLGLGMVHSASVIAVNTAMGTVTPPCAPFIFFAARIGDAKVGEMLWPNLFFLIFAWMPTLILTTYIPFLSEWLPGVLGLPIN